MHLDFTDYTTTQPLSLSYLDIFESLDLIFSNIRNIIARKAEISLNVSATNNDRLLKIDI